jgi:K+/H+ antiporter YhaU regulatory subunit KhtT
MEHMKISIPRYQQIAADIASKIVNGDYKVGEKVYARSHIASQYGVSPETARRAMCVLADLKIVEAEKGSGVEIVSFENAMAFAKQFQNIETINSLKQSIMSSVERQKKEMENFNHYLSELIAKTDRYRSVNPFVPFQIPIEENTPYLNQSIMDLNFWHNTTATVIAIKREGAIILSPGPYAVLLEKDVLYFIGDDSSFDRVKKFLYPEV